MGQPPAWASELMAQVCSDAGVPQPEVTWRMARSKVHYVPGPELVTASGLRYVDIDDFQRVSVRPERSNGYCEPPRAAWPTPEDRKAWPKTSYTPLPASGGVVHVSAGADLKDQHHTLLHELGHHIAHCRGGPDEAHGQYWREVALGLYEKYGDALYSVQREAAYLNRPYWLRLAWSLLPDEAPA